MVDIYMFKIGGTPDIKNNYNHTIMCDHFPNTETMPRQESVPQSQVSNCIKDEYCEYGKLLPRDLNTIQAGFNLFQTLQIFEKILPNNQKIESFKRDLFKFKVLASEKSLL